MDMTTEQKLHQVRDQMRQEKIGAYLIPITDPHMSEYVPLHWRTIEWFSGFTGSAGTLVITADFAGLWTDSRYFIQAGDQLRDSGIELVQLKIPHTPEYIDWLLESLTESNVVGCHGEMWSIGLVKTMRTAFKARNIKLRTDMDLVGPLWENRPPLPPKPIFEHPLKYTGISRRKKIEQVREEMKHLGVEYHLLTALDDIAWTFNIRGFDSSYSPLVVSFAIIGMQSCLLFIDREKIPEPVFENLEGDGVQIFPYEAIYDHFTTRMPRASIYLSPGTVNTRLFDIINESHQIEEGLTIPTQLKARKNETELANIRDTMVKEGIALVEFFHWLETNLGKTKITEMTIPEKLHELRSVHEGYMGPSFATIAGYNDHGAIVHYEATADTDAEIKPEGILLLDTGGQYLSGTTDMTRTIALGTPTDQQKQDFTLVLKGMIQLAMLRFPEGTRGYQIEAFARKALWDQGCNYGHGTGHGIGYFLNVHEGPQTIGTGASGNRDIALETGMILSDEPGLYRAGRYGIRTENVLLIRDDVENDFGRFLKFETLTLCPIETNLMDMTMLTIEEREWINDYHASVFRKLSHKLSEDVKKWVRSRTRPI
jgi:Xaa-Pro aminopeptidase